MDAHPAARADLGTDRLRVLDIATGAGDVPIALAQKAKRAGLQLEIRGVDVSEQALAFARERARSAKRTWSLIASMSFRKSCLAITT